MIPFRIGDVVLIGKGKAHEVVHGVEINQGKITYGAGGMWWFNHNQLTLVAEATAATVKDAIDLMSEDEEDGEIL